MKLLGIQLFCESVTQANEIAEQIGRQGYAGSEVVVLGANIQSVFDVGGDTKEDVALFLLNLAKASAWEAKKEKAAQPFVIKVVETESDMVLGYYQDLDNLTAPRDKAARFASGEFAEYLAIQIDNVHPHWACIVEEANAP